VGTTKRQSELRGAGSLAVVAREPPALEPRSGPDLGRRGRSRVRARSGTSKTLRTLAAVLHEAEDTGILATAAGACAGRSETQAAELETSP
jgi:hypothetical protein